MDSQYIQKVKPEMEKALDFFSKELRKIRTGQASPSLVEDVEIDVFGQKMLLKQLAAISTPERRQLVIQPWDKSYLGAIEKAIFSQAIGVSPVVEQDIIRISLPPLTGEFRDKLLKVVREKEEESKQTLRKLRDDAWGDIQEKARAGEIREDDKFKGKEELQKLIDEYTKRVDEATARKVEEIKEG